MGRYAKVLIVIINPETRLSCEHWMQNGKAQEIKLLSAILEKSVLMLDKVHASN